MEIDISKIISEKLEQMDRDGVIKRKIEEALERSILSAVTSELDSYNFRRAIADQVKTQVGAVAADCGLSAYNGFIAQRVRSIVEDLYTQDIAERVGKALETTMLKKYERVKLSDIFEQYRKWVCGWMDDEEKEEAGSFTRALDVREDGRWTQYVCNFADHPLDECPPVDEVDIQLHLLVYGGDKTRRINRLLLKGQDVTSMTKISRLSEFEAFVVNLYYNETEIELDMENVDQDGSFDRFEP